MKTFSFITHPIAQLHDFIPGIMPGIEKIVTVYYNENQNMVIGSLTEKIQKIYSTKPLKIDEILPSLVRLMDDKSPYSWYSRQNLPFEVESRGMNPTITIFSELQNIVLLIRVPDSKNEMNDLIFLYLNENPSNFGVTNSINPLTTDNKSIIAFLLNNTIRAFLNIQRNDKSALKQINRRTRSIIQQAETLKEQIDKTAENYGVSLVKLCQHIVDEHQNKSGRQIRLSSSALQKIKAYNGDIRELETVIRNAIGYAESLAIDESESIEINEWHLFSEPVLNVSDAPQEEKLPQEDKYSRTVQLLDKLESAALIVKQKRLKMTGTNVGSSCEAPISAPAISDALYNHKSKIQSLVTMHPHKWSVLKEEFRPFQNILNR
ncbi:MAG TPA: hypothetical protein P5514_02415 [Bacteroidales bacterium]|nr:hypothetical protein [Bacteroidales bacterium]HRX95774.1 hypothetical protein [Bacteroidales bacterium]